MYDRYKLKLNDLMLPINICNKIKICNYKVKVQRLQADPVNVRLIWFNNKQSPES